MPTKAAAKKMNPKVKEKWVAALRSGKFKQARSALRVESEDGVGYCCLGVLCEVHRQSTKRKGWSRGEEYMGESAFLPEQVAKWAGLEIDNDGDVKPPKCHKTLAQLNDGSGKNFDYIAGIIERNL